MIYFLYIIVCVLALPFQFPAVAVLLLTKWDGRSTIFGNKLYGRGNTHPTHATQGYWQELLWLTVRNPINNLLADFAAIKTASLLIGNEAIGDKIAGGKYQVIMVKAWEFYYIKPYGKRCVRVRLGWKIQGKQLGEICPMVFVINPVMPYTGSA